MSKILIIDDDISMHELYHETLSPSGYQLLDAYNGKEGLAMIEEEEPDLIILDMTMPEMNGRSALIEIKKRKKSLPILVISGKSGMQQDPEIEMNAQVHRFLVKPPDVLELLMAVEKILSQSQKLSFSWIGQNIFGCQITRMLGQGASGSVYEATLGKKSVAVKMIPGQKMDQENLERFRKEAKSLAQIKHHNVIGLVDVGNQEDHYFIIMEFFEGGPLEEHIYAKRHLTVPETISVTKQIAQGMQVVHNEGIVHRDIKASNILYNKEHDWVKIIDFGIVRDIHSEASLTPQGCVLGTPYYMSPEQCWGDQNLTPQSDIYSLGILVYQMLIGDLPFVQGSPVEILRSHIYDEIPWPAYVSRYVPHFMKTMIDKMTQKDIEKRYISMQEVVDDLDYASQHLS